MLPLPRVERLVSRRDGVRGEAEQRAERGRRIEPPVEPEDVLVAVRLQVLLTHAVVRPEQPGLVVREHQVHERQVLILQIVVRIHREPVMLEAKRRELVVTLPAVRAHD